jgi:hypothetical protein
MGVQHRHMMGDRAGTGGVVRRLTAVLEFGGGEAVLVDPVG